jgi:hypothetical protein
VEEQKTYQLYISPFVKIMVFGMLAPFTIVGFVIVAASLISDEGQLPPFVFGLVWLSSPVA